MNGGSSPSPDVAVALSPRARQAVLAAMCLSLVLVVASVAMLNVALRAIAVDLGPTQAELQWIVDAYVLLLAALLLPCGALGDRFGRRSALLAGIVIFGVASAVAATADTPTQLIAWRAVAGVGAALIMPGTLSTITSVFPDAERARAVGVWAGFAGGGAVLGMIVAGALLETFWWGSVFVAIAALAVVALVATLVAVPNTKSSEDVHLDPFGAVLSFAGIGGLVLGIIEGPARGWNDPLTVTGLAVGVGAGVAFVAWELRTRRPLLDPRLFRVTAFATGTTALTVLFLAMFGFFFLVLQFLQLMLGYGALEAAVALLPMAITMLPLATLAATLSERYGQRNISTLGLLVSTASFAYLATLTTSSGYWHLFPGLLAVGAGVALSMTPATNAIVGSLPLAKQGVASAVNDTAREVGAALGIAVLGSAFNSGYRHDIGSVTGHLPAVAVATVKDSPAGAFAVAQKMGSAGRAVTEAARAGFITGMHWAVLVGAALLILCAGYVWLRAPSRAAPARHDAEPDVLAAESLEGVQ